jgi:hypothetical protein
LRSPPQRRRCDLGEPQATRVRRDSRRLADRVDCDRRIGGLYALFLREPAAGWLPTTRMPFVCSRICISRASRLFSP